MNRSRIREQVLKLLYCHEFHEDSDMDLQFEERFNDLPKISEDEKEYITNRVNDIYSHKDEIDDKIGEASIGWKVSRMSKIDLAILRLAYYEMEMDDDIPKKVAIDQAVELAKLYGTDDSASFVNGILSNFME